MCAFFFFFLGGGFGFGVEGCSEASLAALAGVGAYRGRSQTASAAESSGVRARGLKPTCQASKPASVWWGPALFRIFLGFRLSRSHKAGKAV